MKEYIDPTAKVSGSHLDPQVSVYRDAVVKNCRIGPVCWVGEDALLTDSELCGNNSINRRNFILRSRIGRYTYTGIDTLIRSATVGKYCSISWNVSIGGGDHGKNGLTTLTRERFLFLDDAPADQRKAAADERVAALPTCTMGNDVWVAAGAIINNGVTIGDGAIIGAGAVVNRDVPPYAVVVGVPAKVLKQRFADDVSEALLLLKWWDWPVDLVRANMDLIFSTRMDMDVVKRLQDVSIKQQ